MRTVWKFCVIFKALLYSVSTVMGLNIRPWTNILHNQRKLLWKIRWRVTWKENQKVFSPKTMKTTTLSSWRTCDRQCFLAMLVGFGPDWNISRTIVRTVIEIYADTHVAQRKNPSDFDFSLTFPVPPPWGRPLCIKWIAMKFGADIHSERIKCTDFNNALTFHLLPSKFSLILWNISAPTGWTGTTICTDVNGSQTMYSTDFTHAGPHRPRQRRRTGLKPVNRG